MLPGKRLFSVDVLGVVKLEAQWQRVGEVPFESVGQPAPDDEDRRRAHLLAKGAKFGPEAEEIMAGGIAAARHGGDVTLWARRLSEAITKEQPRGR